MVAAVQQSNGDSYKYYNNIAFNRISWGDNGFARESTPGDMLLINLAGSS